jgi:hypothetical protein
MGISSCILLTTAMFLSRSATLILSFTLSHEIWYAPVCNTIPWNPRSTAGTQLSAFTSGNTYSCPSRWPRGLRSRSWRLLYWDRGFESRSRYGCLSLCFCVVLSCVAFATGWSLVQRSPTSCLNEITKPPVWGGQGPYKDCRATGGGDWKIMTVQLYYIA